MSNGHFVLNNDNRTLQYDQKTSGGCAMLIRETRIRANISQAELGRRVGMDQSGISRLERGQRPVTVDMLKALAEALGVSPAALLEEEIKAA
jgi:transcriptional regulator with XRE-family HTH domain